jgi:hypothetical protein
MRKSLIVVFAMSLLAAACGGSSDTSTETATDSTSGPATTAPTSAPSGSSDEYCRLVLEIEASIEAIETEGLDFGEELGKLFRVVGPMQIEATKVAPAEIAADANKFAEGMTAAREMLEAVDYDLFALTEEQLAIVDNPEFDNANEAIETYNETECGVVNDDASAEDDGVALSDENIDSLLSGPNRAAAISPMLELGLNEDAAVCVMRDTLQRGSNYDPAAPENLEALIGVMTDCGVSLEDLARIGLAEGDVEIDATIEQLQTIFTPELIETLRTQESARVAMAAGLASSGLDDPAARCVVDAIAETGTDAVGDATTFLDLFLNCDVSISDLASLS